MPQPSSSGLAEMESLLNVDRIPRKSWNEVKFDIYSQWSPTNAPHHSIISITGGGKSYLATRGLLPMRGWRRTLIIDNKGDDDTLRDVGRRVRELPKKDPWFRKKKNADSRWYRLMVHEDWAKGREQVKNALAQVYSQGNWTVFVDETRNLTDPRVPSLNLRNYVEQIWLRGRSRGVELVSMTQAPRWVPSSFYDQPSFVWIGRINDERAHQRLREIGGLKRQHLGIIQNLQRREFLVIGNGGDYTAITRVPDLARSQNAGH
jgi:hypothetical protein